MVDEISVTGIYLLHFLQGVSIYQYVNNILCVELEQNLILLHNDNASRLPDV